MASSSAQFFGSRVVGASYTSNYQIATWEESFRAGNSQNTGSSSIVEGENKLDNRMGTMQETAGPSKKYEQKANKHSDKVLRRLAQNREAARKSRLKKKAYVQQLESCRMKLNQLEQEVQRGRQQGILLGNTDSSYGLSGAVNSGIAAFEMEYAHWVEEQNRQNGELRAALQQHVSDIELRMLVEAGMNHFEDLFRIKSLAAKSDIFFLMSGMWKTSVERFFMWIGGFRPSELLKVIVPQLDPLTGQQFEDVYNLQQSSQQAEDALSQGMERLQQTLAEALASDPLDSTSSGVGQMAAAINKLEALESFVTQADHLRHQALQQIFRILTTRQAARGLLALGDYFHRLRALSSLWSARPHDST